MSLLKVGIIFKNYFNFVGLNESFLSEWKKMLEIAFTYMRDNLILIHGTPGGKVTIAPF